MAISPLLEQKDGTMTEEELRAAKAAIIPYLDIAEKRCEIVFKERESWNHDFHSGAGIIDSTLARGDSFATVTFGHDCGYGCCGYVERSYSVPYRWLFMTEEEARAEAVAAENKLKEDNAKEEAEREELYRQEREAEERATLKALLSKHGSPVD